MKFNIKNEIISIIKSFIRLIINFFMFLLVGFSYMESLYLDSYWGEIEGQNSNGIDVARILSITTIVIGIAFLIILLSKKKYTNAIYIIIIIICVSFMVIKTKPLEQQEKEYLYNTNVGTTVGND